MAERQTRTSPCPSRFGPGRLRTNVDIDQHPTLGCMKNIVGTFDFQRPGEPWVRAGTITAFIVDKRTPGVLDQNLRVRKQWIQELLAWKRTDPIVYPVEHAVSQALSVFYNAAGARRPRYWPIDRELHTRRIVFVDSFVMHAHYRRGGTGSVAFGDFHRVLHMYRGGPNTNSGALKLLQADIIDLRHLAVGQTEGDYQKGLIRFYNRHRYTVCHRDWPDAPQGYTFTFMRRRRPLVPSAQQYLLSLTDAPNEVPSGPALLRADYLAPRVVAMGNIIPALAAVNGRPYTAAQWATWRSMITQLPGAFARRDKQVMDAGVLLMVLCGYLNPLGSSAEVEAFFGDGETPLTIDMGCLLLFVGWSSVACWGERARRRRERRQAGGAKGLAGRRCEVM
ncbi:hypothetical protein LTR29_010847 [Friedmanniomyces endolithicus]|nr:hypothetical protein LTR29_010847 [Friedmanniomyces endolithicus]